MTVLFTLHVNNILDKMPDGLCASRDTNEGPLKTLISEYAPLENKIFPAKYALTAVQMIHEGKYLAGFPNSTNCVKFCYILASLQVTENQ